MSSVQPITTEAQESPWKKRYESLRFDVRDFVEGSWHTVAGERSMKKYGPRDGRLLATVGSGDPATVDTAVRSARRAFEDGRWSAMPVQQRKEVMLTLAQMLEERREEFALLECLDVGKPISDALTVDVPMASAGIRYCAEAADKIHGKVYATDQSSVSYELRRPIGVVAGIVGWNFPLVLAGGKIGPVLATGNSLVLKPSELTCFSAAKLAELALAAGVPEGVLNVIHGDAAVGAALAAHHDVDQITFTGSSQTGKKLLVASGESNMKRLILECGGKAPNIVFDDAPDLDAVAQAVVSRAFWNQGQVCTASSRLLVQANIKEKLLPRIIKKVSEMRSGDPLDPQTRWGAVVSAEHRQKILAFVEDGETKGAKMVYRGDVADPVENGFYLPATIFDEVLSHFPMAQEEIFGPVLSVMTFKDEAEAIRMANATIYGLSAILWTKDLGRAHRITHAMHAGWVVVNATEHPAGGPGEGVLSIGGHKASGLGVEGGLEGLEAYLSKTAVQIFV